MGGGGGGGGGVGEGVESNPISKVFMMLSSKENDLVKVKLRNDACIATKGNYEHYNLESSY